MKILSTSRGFEYIPFKDRYGCDCSLQQSSLADFQQPGSSAIWFGAEKDRAHIDYEQLKELLPHLQAWVETGSFHLTRRSTLTWKVRTALGKLKSWIRFSGK